MKKEKSIRGRLPGLIFLLSAALSAAGCGVHPAAEETTASPEPMITVGFSQLGAESDWRNTNTQSIREAFTPEKGYNLIFEDGQQKQELQITAVRSFIQQEVDYIVLAPVRETGWDTVLEEARDAGIPVIIVDRMVDVGDDSLYTAWVGSDFMLEGRKAAEWLHRYATAQGVAPEELHIVDIQGTIGASAQIGRTQGVLDGAERYGWDLIGAETGDYTEAKSREVMESLLARYDNINVVYCENDNEAFGAIDILKAEGRTVGTDLAGGDVLVMSFDATRGGLTKVLEGEIALNTECNPLQGEMVEEIIETLEKGGQPPKRSYVPEELFGADLTVPSVRVDGNDYPVRIVTEELIGQRAY